MEFRLALDDFDKSLLGVAPTLLEADPSLFRKSVETFFTERLTRLGGRSQIVIDETAGTIVINWTPLESKTVEDIKDYAVSLLKAGRIDEAVSFLKLVLSSNPHDALALCTLGRILSDKGRLDEALSCLKQAVQVAPDYADAWIALGVASNRARDIPASREAAKRAIQLAPQNGYACRNYAAVLMQGGEMERAKEYFEQARQLLKDDPATLFGLAGCLFELNDLGEADPILIRVLELCPTGPTAEAAKKLRRKIVATTFRAAGVPRFDAIVFCLEALRLFADKPKKETLQIVFEIALLGHHGLDINHSEAKYRLKTLPGQFSGLQLLAFMYVGYKVLDLEMEDDLGLSKEYEVAMGMFKPPPKRG